MSLTDSEPGAGVVEREEELVDLILPIEAHTWHEDGHLSLVVRGRVHGVVIGFAVELEPHWSAQPIEDSDITVYWGGGQLCSLGTESDDFLDRLAQEYGLPHAAPMAACVTVCVAGMDCDPTKLREEPARLKLFFEEGGDDAYAEAYLNLDLAEGVAAFRDKDADYHPGLLRALSRSGPTADELAVLPAS